MKVIFTFSSKQATITFRLLVLAATCLTLVGFIGSYTFWPEDWGLRDFLSQLDPGRKGLQVLGVGEEGSVPTWFSSALLLLCALLAFGQPATNREHAVRYAGRWKVLALWFLLMSLDEVLSLHERTGEPLRAAFKFNAGGPFYYAWVIPGAIVVLGFALAYYKFLLNLPPEQRRLFAIAGTLYVCGALIMEMVGGAYADSYGDRSIANLMLVSVEEYLEMLGIATLLYALMLRTAPP